MKIYKQGLLNIARQYWGYILFISMCVIAFSSFEKYGISWDEDGQRWIGITSFNYIVHGNQTLNEWTDRDYGVAFELPLIAIERIFNLTDTRDIYLMRHLITHLFFLIGALFGYKLVYFLYKNKLLATVGFLFIILHPRIYTQSFFNTKDIPFMTMFLISLYFNAIAFNKKKIINFVILGISIGILINLRIAGIILPLCILTFAVIDAISEKKYLHHLKLISFFGLTTIIVLFASWPYLWTDPINNFIHAFANMSHFRWGGEILFNGKIIKGTAVGWNYIPIWFSITTPLFYLFTGLAGIVLLIIKFIKKPLILLLNTKERNNIFFIICFLSPIFIAIALNSVLYDGWRHLYFIYPSFVLLAIYGLNFFIRKKKNMLLIASSILTFIFITGFMVKHYPIQHVYYNCILRFTPPEYIRNNFEMDYWGVSYRQSLEYILENDDSPIINVNISNFADYMIIKILSPKDRNRVNFVPFEKATYFITNYRWHPQDYEELKNLEYHSFKIANNTVNKIFKLN